MTQTIVKAKPQVKVIPTKVKPTYNRNVVADIYIITDAGVTMLVGKDGNGIRQKIEQASKPVDYKFFDDDNKRWAYWAIKNGDGIKPPSFPGVTEYSLTSSQLYTKAITFLHIFAHAVGLLKDKPPTLWDRMLKPTTIIMAIVAIVFVMGLMLMALTG